MLCYSTYLKVNSSFNKSILLDMFFDWLNHTKNKMNGLNYDNSDEFHYEVHHKQLDIIDFKEYSLFGIRFITSDNYKKNEFTIEILYSYQENTLHLNFYKDINDDSRYISALTLPKIFQAIFHSDFLQKDNEIIINDQPLFVSYKHYRDIIDNRYNLPVVVLYKDEKCCISPVKLSKEIVGIGHVVCTFTKNYKDRIDILYPDGSQDILKYNNNQRATIKSIGDKVRNYMLQECSEFLNFDDIKRLRLQKIHDVKKESTKEIQEVFQLELEEKKQECFLLKEEFKEKQKYYERLVSKKKETDQELQKYNKEAIIITDKKDEEVEKYVKDLVIRTLRNLDNVEVYRKRDVLEGVKRSNKL